MKTLPPALAEHLKSGTTTLCHCWRLDLRRGEAMGFTDHDRALAFGGLTYEADTGFTASEIESGLGLSVDNLEASGALSSVRISEARIAAGDFDDAKLEIWRVNWQDVSQRVLLKRGRLGEITRRGAAFSAEFRGLSHLLNQPQGRVFQYGCDAELGDPRCGVNLADPDYRAEAIITGGDGQRVFVLAGISGFVAGFFARGIARDEAGGRVGRIKFHRGGDGAHEIELWQPWPEALANGARLTLTAGCDKQFATCRAKFSNARNFRGFPHMPGDDFVMRYALREGK